MFMLKISFILFVSDIAIAATSSSSKDAGGTGGRIASVLAGATSITSAQPGGTSQATQAQRTGSTTLHTTHKSVQHASSVSAPATMSTCSIINPIPDAIPPVEAHCLCLPGSKTCAQYYTAHMDHSDVCRKCETDFIELPTTTQSDIPQETVLSQCWVQSQVGINQDAGESIESCGTPTTITKSGTIVAYPGEAVLTDVTGFAGTSLAPGVDVTVPVGEPTTIGTVAPQITAISATGLPNDPTQGVWVGPMTGSNLWFNISSAVESACTGTAFPVTACADPVITGVPYPSAPAEAGYDPELAYGELHINMNEVMLKDAKTRSLFAYYLGMNAAASVERMGDKACKKLHTAPLEHGRVTLEGPRSPLMGCFMPLEFILEEYNGVRTDGPDSMIWAQFYFTGDHKQAADLECQAVNAAVDGFLAVLMAALSMIPGGGAAAGAVGRAGIQAGSREARQLGVRAVEAGESIKFGCKSIEDAKEAVDRASGLHSGNDLSEENTDSLLDAILGDGSDEDPYKQDLNKISAAWDKFQGVLGA